MYHIPLKRNATRTSISDFYPQNALLSMEIHPEMDKKSD